MYSLFRGTCERVLRIPPDPAPPPGDGASARVFRAAPAYFKYRVVLWAIPTGIGFLSLFVAAVALNVTVVAARGVPAWLEVFVVPLSLFLLVAYVLHALFTLAVTRLNYEKRWYVVTDRSLRVREGVVVVREMTITIANVQNLAVMQGPIQRALGLADLQVETAGGGSKHSHEGAGANLHTAWFRGIDNAQEVKALIQERLRKLKDAGLGDHDDHAAPAAAASFVDALREVRAEAQALRVAAAASA